MKKKLLTTVPHAVWSALPRHHHHAPLPGLKSWLIDHNSLTHRLTKLSRGDLRVEVLNQVYTRPTVEEAAILRLGARQFALIREVLLKNKSHPWVYARSVLPFNCIRGDLRHLACLGNKPLGAELFKNAAISRSPMEFCCVARRNLPATVSNNESWSETGGRYESSVWGRRSVFRIREKRLLVSEYFLPAIPLLISPFMTVPLAEPME